MRAATRSRGATAISGAFSGVSDSAMPSVSFSAACRSGIEM